MANFQLSARVKKLAKDFSIIDGKIQLSNEKLNTWLDAFDAVPAEERDQLAKELIALAGRFAHEGKEQAAIGTAQLYACAAGVLQYDGTSVAPKSKGFTAKTPGKVAAPAAKSAPAAAKAPAKPAAKPPAKSSPKPAAKPAASSSGGWGAKSKR